MNANNRQVGGSHYQKKTVQHWDFVRTNDMTYLGGQVTKYLSRWADKNGVQDLQKAEHFLQKMIEDHEEASEPITLRSYLDGQNLDSETKLITVLVVCYEQTGTVAYLDLARAALAALIDNMSPGPGPV